MAFSICNLLITSGVNGYMLTENNTIIHYTREIIILIRNKKIKIDIEIKK